MGENNKGDYVKIKLKYLLIKSNYLLTNLVDWNVSYLGSVQFADLH